jgi:spore maturation protein CgeB
MSPLSILYLGPQSGTCLHRANALRRLGHQVLHLDLRQMLPRTRWVDRITWRAGGELFTPWVVRGLAQALDARKFDLCHVDNGEWVSSRVIAALRRNANNIINYSIDDPLGQRDGRRFSAYRKALAQYDLVVVMRDVNVREARNLGATNILRVHMSADEVAHAPRILGEQDRAEWGCDVLFVGTWMPERGSFLLSLTKLGVPLTIRGNNWHKAPEWPQLRAFWKGHALEGDDYAKAIQCARINLGLLSKGNRDLHTTRSMEIPALGSLLCAERTTEHSAMYRENEEAVFWSDARECADVCHRLLADDATRQALAARGQLRVRQNGSFNERVLENLVNTFEQVHPSARLSQELSDAEPSTGVARHDGCDSASVAAPRWKM